MLSRDPVGQGVSEKLSAMTESDDVYVTCGEKGIRRTERKARRRGLNRRGRGSWKTDRPPVIGVAERTSREVRLEACGDASKKAATR